MSDRTTDRWDSDDAWSEARERTRSDVKAAFAPRRRVCRECGHEETTARRTCSVCGTPYVSTRESGMSRRAKRRLALAAAAVVAVLAVGAALIVPSVQHSKRTQSATEKRQDQARVTAERRRLTADQRLHAAAAPQPHAALRGLPPEGLRRALVADLAASITADARARVRAHSLEGPIRRTDCSPLPGFAGPPVGKYTCTAVNAEILRRAGQNAGTLGYPFWAVVDFKRLSYVWCKVNPKAGEGSATAGAVAVTVPLPPACDIGA